MAQLTVELDDREMERLQAAARARRIDPNRMTRLQLLQVLIAPAELVQKKSWRGSALARHRAAKPSSGTISFKIMKHAVKLMAERRQTIVKVPVGNEKLAPVDAARAKRLAAIMSVHGMWKGDPDKPRDAVEYQREMRAEWP